MAETEKGIKLAPQETSAYERVLQYWFGRVEDTIVPTESRTRVWFADDPAVDEEIRNQFKQDVETAILGQYHTWEDKPRGQLALIILFDQFSRHLFKKSSRAYAQDEVALRVCLEGIERRDDHSLSLIERVFYYFPLLHSEQIDHQVRSLEAYEALTELAFPETRIIYDSFLKFARHHYNIIERFGRFPQRNETLHRVSTAEEVEFLKENDSLGD